MQGDEPTRSIKSGDADADDNMSNTCADTSDRNDQNCLRTTKKPRLLVTDTESSQSSCLASGVKEPQSTLCDSSSLLVKKDLPTRWLLDEDDGSLVASLPPSLSPKTTTTKIGRNVDRLRVLLDKHGLRTTKISSPREAVSIYKDSCRIVQQGDNHNHSEASPLNDGKEFLLVTLGLHIQQKDLELNYKEGTKDVYCLLLFCKRLCDEYDTDQNDSATTDNTVVRLLRKIEETFQSVKESHPAHSKSNEFRSSRFVEEQVTALIDIATNIQGKRRFRAEEWRREYQRIRVCNCTISNAFLFLLQSKHGMCIKDIFFKRNQDQPKYERITMYLYDPVIDVGMPGRPDPFLFLPGLHAILTEGPHNLVSEMINSFWSHVLRYGYFPTSRIQQLLEPQLRSFFLSGLVTATSTTVGGNTNLPLPLKANFLPTSPLSIYLHGKAGAGKSSLAKVLPTALQSTLEQHIDPECMARFVKQNLNKSLKTLELEFQLRPNNNDMSVMSIIQGRRMTMSQSKPGLVVLNLEEMPKYSLQGNPNQLSVAQLISQRFGGRKGDYPSKGQSSDGRLHTAPRNSDKRSIGKDYSLVTIFTSNYPLAEESKTALDHLEIYQSLTLIEMSSITGSDRSQFAKSYLRQCLVDVLGQGVGSHISLQDIVLGIASSDGDTRPLVRQLRMFSYYLGRLYKRITVEHRGKFSVKGIQVSQTEANCTLTLETQIDGNPNSTCDERVTMGSMNNWYPAGPFIFDSRVKPTIEKLDSMIDEKTAAELAVILEFWLSTTLAPAVILSRDKTIIEYLMDSIASMGDDIHCIRKVDTQNYKMIKSLYDPKETPNLRDDILKFGRGSLVATELKCPTQDSQLCIREMIEDSPSMTAFSSTKSALYKSGLLFAIHVEGQITPEVLSRVSIVL